MHQCLPSCPSLAKQTPCLHFCHRADSVQLSTTCIWSVLSGVRLLQPAPLAGLPLIMLQPTYGEVQWQHTKQQRGWGPPVPPPLLHPAINPHNPPPRHLLCTHHSHRTTSSSSNSRGCLSLRKQSYRYGCSTCTSVRLLNQEEMEWAGG